MSAPSAEVLTLTSIGNAYTTTATVLGRVVMPVFAGGREVKSVLTVQFDGQGEPTSLIERPRHPNSVDLWQEFREAGVTVTPDIFTGVPGKLVAPNLKADGSEIYGKYLSTVLFERGEREPARPDIDELFVGLLSSRKGRRQLDERMAEHGRAAARGCLALPTDDGGELIMHPDGSWDIVLLDLTHGAKLPKDEALYLENQNSGPMTSLDVHLQIIHNRLLTSGVRGRSPRRAKRSTSGLLRGLLK